MTAQAKDTAEESSAELAALDFNTQEDFVADYIHEHADGKGKIANVAPAAQSAKTFASLAQDNASKSETTDRHENYLEEQEFQLALQKLRNRSRSSRQNKSKQKDIKPIIDGNRELRVAHYGAFGIFYIFHLLNKLSFSFCIFPTLVIAAGFAGLKLITQFFLSRQALTWSEALCSLGYVIGVYLLLSPVWVLVFSQGFLTSSYLYTPNILVNIITLSIASALGLKLSTAYEWKAIAWLAPALGIWLLAVSRVGIYLIGF